MCTYQAWAIVDDRYADDAGMNRELREVDRWNDPAAEFLTVSWEMHVVGLVADKPEEEEVKKAKKTHISGQLPNKSIFYTSWIQMGRCR